MTKQIILLDRAIIEIKGVDRKSFLQGLITNDINKANKDTLIYAAMLNAQGRFLYDFFIFEKDDSLFLDCLSSRRDEIFTKLKFYKLRSQVEIIKNDNFEIVQDFENAEKVSNTSSAAYLIFQDPRHKGLGYRIYKAAQKNSNSSEDDETSHHSNKIWHNDNNPEHGNLDEYHHQRIGLKIPEGEYDLTYEKSIIAEFGFDDLNAVDYKKGCYIGQELTARTHYMGQVRKKICHVKIANLHEVEKNSEISCAGKNGGIILSTVYYEDELHALALIKIAEGENETQNEYTVSNNKITIIS